MEFTFEGLVRWSFGFQNPNHAAALMNIWLPFLWYGWSVGKWRVLRWGCCVASFLLIAGIAYTFSRTGLVVLVLEAGGYLVLRRLPWKRCWGRASVVVLIAVAVFIAAGSMKRFTGNLAKPDRAVTNRFDIWRGGLELAFQNPAGVGLGRSGTIFSAFQAPEAKKIECRTLISSWLTFMAEFGLVPTLALAAFFCYALMGAWRRHSAWGDTLLVALGAGMLSAGTASCFDWDILWNHAEFSTAYLMAWVLAGSFGAVLLLAAAGKVRAGQLFTAMLGGIAVTFAAYDLGGILNWGKPSLRVYATDAGPLVETGVPGGERILVLRDDRHDLKAVRRFLEEHEPKGAWLISYDSQEWHSEPKWTERVERVLIMGNAAHWSESFECEAIHLVSPPPRYRLPENVERLYLARYKEQAPRNRRNVQLVFY